MANKFKNDAQRENWNKYNSKYAKQHYRTITVKLSKEEFAKEIAYLEGSPLGLSGAVKKMLKEYVSKKAAE